MTITRKKASYWIRYNMGLAIFEDYSQSTEGTNYAPFIVEMSHNQCFDRVLYFLKENNYQEIDAHYEYNEIYAKDGDFEITFTISKEDQHSLVNASVYGPKGKTRKKLKEILKNLISYFTKG